MSLWWPVCENLPVAPRHKISCVTPPTPTPTTTTTPILRILAPHRPLTCGTSANKSRLVPERDPSIIAREHLKITQRDMRRAEQPDRQTEEENGPPC